VVRKLQIRSMPALLSRLSRGMMDKLTDVSVRIWIDTICFLTVHLGLDDALRAVWIQTSGGWFALYHIDNFLRLQANVETSSDKDW
jgi:hypothetical protein